MVVEASKSIICPVGQQAENSCRRWCYVLESEGSLEAESLPLWGNLRIFSYGLQLIGWRQLTLWRKICFIPKFTDLNVNLIKKKKKNLHSSMVSDQTLEGSSTDSWQIDLTITATRGVVVGGWGVGATCMCLCLFAFYECYRSVWAHLPACLIVWNRWLFNPNFTSEIKYWGKKRKLLGCQGVLVG